MDWNAAAPAAIVGAVVATLGIFLAELWLKPQLARSRVATILAVELRLNVRLIDLAIEQRRTKPDLVSESFQLSLRAWDVAADELQYLPEAALRPLLLVYNQFREINELVANHSKKGDLIMQLEGVQARVLFSEFQNETQLFDEQLVKIRGQCERTLPHLQRIVDGSLTRAAPLE